MKNKLVSRGLLAALAFSLALADVPARAAKEVPNFMLLDDHGKAHEFHRTEGKVAVLFFTGPIDGKRFMDASENSDYWYFVVASWLPIWFVIYFVPRWL